MTVKTWGLWALGAALLAGPAQAQEADGGLEFKAVNPGGADVPEALVRELPEADGGQVEVPREAVPAEPPAPAPAATPAASLWGADLGVNLRASSGGATLFPFDSERTTSVVSPLETRVRVAPEIRFGGFGLVAEADAATGAVLGTPPDALVSDRQPVPAFRPLELRKLYLEYRWQTGAFRVGQQTSNWGLGLLANDGAADPQAGDFGQQHFGNLTYRALLSARPLASLGGRLKALETVLAADLIVRDNFGEFARGDRAFQGVLALRFNRDAEHQFGVYAVYRSQQNLFVTDGGKRTNALVVDFAGRWELMKRRHRDFQVGWEVVGITGTTTQARNENAEVLRLAQFGAAFKSAYRVRRVTLFLDGGYASGDQNPADDRVESFRFDRDYKVGLVLFDQVMAYQSGRSAVRASDPNLTGLPPEGADLLGTAGSVTGAWYLFPRLKFALADWFDVYGGPLFAFSTAKLTDAFNTRIGGGTSVNPLGGVPGRYLGTEVDLGVQARFTPIPELLLSLTGEGGVFLPGDAYTLPTGGVMAPVAFGRVRLSVGI